MDHVEDKTLDANRQTLLQRAEADLVTCGNLLLNISWKHTACQDNVRLLRAAVVAARRSQVDDGLYQTYQTIYGRIQGWWFRDDFIRIFRVTCDDLGAGALDRQGSEATRLTKRNQELEGDIADLREQRAALGLENQDLKAALTTERQSIQRLEQAIKDKDETLATVREHVQILKSKVSELKNENDDLRRQLAEKNKLQGSAPIPPTPRPLAEGKHLSPTGGRTFGGGSPISQPSPAAQSFSPKQFFPEEDGPSEGLRGGHSEPSSRVC